MQAYLAVIILLVSAVLHHSLAVDYCYSRSPNSDTGNGTAILCSGLLFCYSYEYTSGGYYEYAGCTSNINFCSSMQACFLCSTDYCNTVTPSSITCRSSSGRGNCSTGISTCYAYSSDGRYTYTGCGTCNGISSSNCRVCNTSYCNSLLPSVINCYSRSSSLTTYSGPGSVLACQNGIPTCYAYTDASGTFGGCGTCNTRSCINCSTNLCNTHFPSHISCFHRSMNVYPYTLSNSNGTLTQCSTGITTCYNARIPLGHSQYMEYSGCGVCSSSDTFCSTCNSSSGCNYFVNYFHLPTTAGTASSTTIIPSAASITTGTPATTSRPPVPSTTTSAATASMSHTTSASISAATTGNPISNRPFTMKCYFTFGETDYSKRAKVTCTSTSCFQFSFSRGMSDYFFAGCGNCSLYSGLFINCQTCFDDFCNSGQDLIVGAKLHVAACICSLIMMLLNKQLI